MQLIKVGEDRADIVECVGPLGVPGHLRDLPRREL